MLKAQGILYYLMGASGTGKDTLLNYLRNHRPSNVLVAHRYITREPSSSGEVHIPLSKAEFLKRRKAGLFCMTWQAHDLWYGLGIEVEAWLERGFHVLVNGSREAFPRAAARFSNLQGVLVQADPDIIRQRLAHRGREEPGQIASRMQRNIKCGTKYHNVLPVKNNSKIETAGQKILRLIQTGSAWTFTDQTTISGS